MIDPNNANNLNPQDINNNVSNPIDPSFLPKDSNVYVRTMNTDLADLKSRGGESLPYVETPSPITNSAVNNEPLETIQNPTPIMPSLTPNVTSTVDFSNLKPVEPIIPPVINDPVMPSTPNLNDVLKAEVPTSAHTTLEGIKSKIDELNATPSNGQNKSVNNLSSNLNSELNNLITPEEFSPMANVDFNPAPARSKNKLMIILLILFLILILGLV